MNLTGLLLRRIESGVDIVRGVVRPLRPPPPLPPMTMSITMVLETTSQDQVSGSRFRAVQCYDDPLISHVWQVGRVTGAHLRMDGFEPNNTYCTSQRRRVLKYEILRNPKALKMLGKNLFSLLRGGP